MIVKQAVGVAVALALALPVASARAQGWRPPACDLKPGHYLVNSGVLYLKNAADTKFEDQRQKDLRDADRVLMQALTSGNQQKNPAAWYYLARYYVVQQDLRGADSAFARAVELAPQCKADIDLWRRSVWVPILNAGVQAWQAGNTDSAMASFRRANQIYHGEPTGFVYLATLLANASQPDSAARYFRLAAEAARDTQYAKDKRDALFNVARVYHAAQRWDDAAAGYRQYLAAYPNDVQALAALALVYTSLNKRDSATALFDNVLAHADSASANDLFAAGQSILNGIPAAPDTMPVFTQCRAEARKNRTLTPRQVAARCDSAVAKVLRAHDAAAAGQYRMAGRAYEAALAKNPYDRDGLFNFAGISYILKDTAKALPVAQRLCAVDPLNRSSLAKLAGAWQLQRKNDSTLKYLQIAESLEVEVTVGTFTTDEHGATVGGVFTNYRAKPNRPLKITFELLSERGDVVASQTVDVPPIDAGGNQAFNFKVIGAGIAAWRYKKG